ncbi:MAG: methyltransferase domain-containing protein [Bryobacteraceae bacterium]|jgi:SAM-dependent methyltransferase
MKIAHLDVNLTHLDFLGRYVAGKTVLDVGCVEHEASSEASEFWLHRRLVESAKSVLGIDVVEKEVEELRRRGYNIICADAMTASLGQTFDVIVVGEVIEHVVNPGALLTNMRRHLNEDGKLILTTPHTFYFLNVLTALFSWQKRWWHPDHVAWYEPYVLSSMLRKTGYIPEVCYYFTRSRKLRRLLGVLHLPCFGFLAMSIMVIARRAPSVDDTMESPVPRAN